MGYFVGEPLLKQTHLDKLNVMHNRIVRNITYKNRRDSAGPLYKSLNILPLNGLLLSEQAKFLYQFTNNMLPQVFSNYMSTPSHIITTQGLLLNRTSVGLEYVLTEHKTPLNAWDPRSGLESHLK